ncbi:MAG TPA: L-histidine N(alpha)-methyltransferase [Pirellulales bacterium]|jgi:dimethylhistidine N-methyltransferase|nr:L-histidine N(alpha)-methyltransferase [Pirellulales bacterium]
MPPSPTLAGRAFRAHPEFLRDVVAGLDAPAKELPCKYFYDQRGSALFERICVLDEYYLTRSELAIMHESASEMGEQIGSGAMLIEYGSGSSVKTRYLLDALSEPVAYVPVDISGEQLEQTAAELTTDYPRIEILPVCADFTASFELPTPRRRTSHAAVYFPGSTIGNFMPDRAVELLRAVANMCGTGGGLLIGIDLKKDPAKIEAAYNDALGITAQFNLNLLQRINRELDGNFCLDQFQHRAVYNAELGRVEIDLVSRCDQRVIVAGRSFDFKCGEAIRTEYSHKYSVEEFAAMAAPTGLVLHREWIDRPRNFAVLHLAIE